MDIVIKKARQEDLGFIFSLLKQVNMHYIPSKEMPSLTFNNYVVARINGKVIGFCGYKVLSKDKGKTELMAVDREYRGRGIGTMLQTHRMEEMLRKGIKIVITNSDLPESIEWYKTNFGYREIGKLKKFHEFGDPNIDHWTTLQVDLTVWEANRRRGKGHDL